MNLLITSTQEKGNPKIIEEKLKDILKNEEGLIQLTLNKYYLIINSSKNLNPKYLFENDLIVDFEGEIIIKDKITNQIEKIIKYLYKETEGAWMNLFFKEVSSEKSSMEIEINFNSIEEKYEIISKIGELFLKKKDLQK